jgi:O-antigen ligase
MALFSDWLLGMMGRRPAGADSLRSGWGMLLFFSAIGVAAFASILGLIFSWSRGAWMGFLAGLASMVVLWPRRTRYGLASLGVAGLLGLAMWQVGLVPTTVESRISSFTSDLTLGDVRGVDINDANYAVLERVAHWQAALDMARDHLWLGVGFGNYGAAYPNYALLNWPDALGHAHNYYLNLFAELGLLGLIAYLIAWMTIFWQTYRVLRRERTAVRGIALGLMGIWVALSVHHLVDKLYVNNIYIHLGVLLGLLQLADLHAASGEQVGEIEAGR